MAKGRGGKTPSSPSESKDKDTLDIPVKFGGFNKSPAGEVCRLGFSVEQGNLSLAQARKFFRLAQLDVTLECDPNSNGDTPGQTKLIDDVDDLQGIAEAHHWSDGNRITSGLTFQVSAINPGSVMSFAGKAGRIKAIRIGDAEQRKPGRPAKEDDADDPQEMDGE